MKVTLVIHVLNQILTPNIKRIKDVFVPPTRKQHIDRLKLFQHEPIYRTVALHHSQKSP